MCEKRQAFLVPSGPDKHLYIAITEADDDEMFILINISSIVPDISHDATCVLQPGEHEFIDRDSYVAYRFAIERRGSHVDDYVKDGVWIPREDASDDLVAKICQGLKKSAFTKRGIKDAYDRCVRAAERRKKQAAKK